MIKDRNIGINGGLSAAFYTLGCRVNQYETQAIEEQFRNVGFEIRSFDEECDVYVINTCTVTAESDRKSRQIIRRTAQVKKQSSIVIVCGCYSQGKPEDITSIDGVDIILGNTRKTEIVRLALEYLKNKKERVLVEDISTALEFEDTVISSSDRTRAFVKIVDGCENHCTYCIIPSVRGKIRSRSKESIINEVTRLRDNGYKEIVLTGIETAAYGRELKEKSESPLVALIESVAEINGIERIRLGSMEPTIFTEEFVKRISSIKKLMPHYHLSLQSGSNAILRLMKRKYNVNMFYDVLDRLRKHIPDVQITTDIIVGFPNESDYLFDETIAFTEKCRFSFIHIFPYSKREGTPAASMPRHLDKATKKSRVTRLEEIMRKIRSEILTSYVGKETSILLETEGKNVIDGYTPNYIKTIIDTKKLQGNKSGDIVNAVITGTVLDNDGTLCLKAEPIA